MTDKLNFYAESTYIYIQHNNLKERFKLFSAPIAVSNGDVDFCIAETGFGTATNFLAVVDYWLKYTPDNYCLHYISFEKKPLTKAKLIKAHANNSKFQNILAQLIQNYPFLLPGWHDLYLFNGRVRLTLWFGNLLLGLPEFTIKADVWFLDKFNPTKNHDMWQPATYSQIARLSHNKTTFAASSYTIDLCKGLEQVGFSVQKLSGIAEQTEICFGSFIRSRKFTAPKPWFTPPKHLSLAAKQKKACIVGAGLAGATVAYKLASNGWQVDVIEAQEDIASQASGNLAGAIHPLITADWNIRSQFYLQGYETTLRWLSSWIKQKEIIGNLNGLMQLATSEKIQHRLQDSLQRVGIPSDFAMWHNAEQASKIIGIETKYSGMFFNKAGWVNPKSVIEKCLSHSNITVHTRAKVTSIQQLSTQHWHIKTKQLTFNAPVLIVASAGLDNNLNNYLGLNIRPVKGQVSHIQSSIKQKKLKTTVTHQGYSISNLNINGKIASVTGATFEAPSLSFASSKKANVENVYMAKKALPAWLNITDEEIEQLNSKVGFRPTSSDHLPLIGAVVNSVYADKHYYSQSHSHAVFRYPQQQYKQGLYVSNGHGARGLMSVFLAAEMIYAQIAGKTPVLANSLVNATHLERFRIRSWRSNKQMK